MSNESPAVQLPGHVFVWRTYRGVPFQHHGVDLGDGSVVHFTDGHGGIAGPGGDRRTFRICQTPQSGFSPEGDWMIHRVEHARPLDAERIRRRALRSLGRGRYELLSNNCEHFACWCVTGDFHSRQVGVAMERAASAATKSLLALVGRVGARSVLATSRTALSLSRVTTPWMLASDAAQWTTEALGHHVGLSDPQQRRTAGRAVGATTAALCGLAGGPVGVLVAAGIWAAGESAANRLDSAIRRDRS